MFRPISRRQVLGTALAAAAIPRGAIAQQGRDPNKREPSDVRIRLTFNDLVLTATLYDNPSARDLALMLPLDLRIEDFGGNEKIVRLPRKLTEEASGRFTNEEARRSLLLQALGQPRSFLCGLSLGGADPSRPF
ncbi:hypothetical protein AT5A_25400 [Agrobacterium tumefaciens 5A]|nr:hypothetical protein AT5A_25400 [Agrobacterium tumefaciens 5A]